MFAEITGTKGLSIPDLQYGLRLHTTGGGERPHNCWHMLDFTPVLYMCINRHVFTLISCHRTMAMIISYQPCRYNTGIKEQKLSFTKFLFSKQEMTLFFLLAHPLLTEAETWPRQCHSPWGITSAQPHILNSCITVLDISSLQNLMLVFENVALVVGFKMPCRGI